MLAALGARSRAVIDVVPHSRARLLTGEASRLLQKGDVLTLKRVFSSDDVLEYAHVSHDSNPLHFDPESARRAGFKGCLVHGMLVASLFPRIISCHFPGALYVSQSLDFEAPVFIGDEIVGSVEATALRRHKEKHIAKFSTKCFKNGDLVICGEATAVLPTLAMVKAASTE